MNHNRTREARRPLTVLLDASLEAAILAECERISEETGIRVSMTHVASRAMRAGFAAGGAR